jgi:hypothetical protein
LSTIMVDAPKKASIWRYLKEAFVFRWNLLFFGGAVAAAAIAPSPDIVIPIVVAAEVAYLTMLATIPRFQSAIDARVRAEASKQPGPENAVASKQRLMDVLGGLEPQRQRRFLELRGRCVEMQRIAHAVRGETHDASGATADLRTPALDRLLWAFLRLLLSEQAVQRFLAASDIVAVKAGRERLEARRQAAQTGGDERILRSVTDAIATAEQRIENHEKARSNSEFIGLELDRIEQKIHALMESAVSHTDPDQLSIQVDAVADGIQQTEATIRELQAITGLRTDEEATPSILGGDLAELVTRQ